jgi:TatD DNase family protein
VIDSHCHLADPAFAADLDEVVRRARDAGVTGGLCVLALGNAAEMAQAARLEALWPGLRLAIGVHPHEAREWSGRTGQLESALREALARLPGVRAIGEIGLDYHYDLSPRDVQREVFRAQVQLARDTRLPVVVHTREADEDTVAILREGGGGLRGVFHCFSGTAALARQALDLGFLLSFSGMVTFPKALAIRTVAADAPADRLLVETDCPYLAPAPYRGRRNEPAWVMRTAATIADLRRLDTAGLDAQVTSNFVRLFGP